MLLIGTAEDISGYIPSIGVLIELTIDLHTFYFHRIVLITEQNTYVYRDLPSHIPGEQLAAYKRTLELYD